MSATDLFSGSLSDFQRQLNAMPDGPDKTAALAALPGAVSSSSSQGQSILAGINGISGLLGGASGSTPSTTDSSTDTSSSESLLNPSTWLHYLGRFVMILLGIVIIGAGIFMLKDYKPGG